MHTNKDRRRTQEWFERFLQASETLPLEDLPSQHSQQTDQCLSLPVFHRGREQNWTGPYANYAEHVRGCPFCQKVEAMFQRATGSEAGLNDANESEPPLEGSLLERAATGKRPATPDDTKLVNLVRNVHRLDVEEATRRIAGRAKAETGVERRPGDTALSLTAMARSELWETLEENVRPLLPALLARASEDPGRAGAFLAFLKERWQGLGDRRFRDALQTWLAEFAGKAVDAVPAVNEDLVAATAVETVLRRASADEADWARRFREHVLSQSLHKPEELLAVEPPPDLASVRALPDYLDGLFQEARKKQREVLALFDLANVG